MSNPKNYKVFLCSSLFLKTERDIVENILNNEKTDTFRFDVIRYEIDGDPNTKTKRPSQDLIDCEIQNCDAFIMIAHSWVGKISEHEFQIAQNSKNIKHLYILHCICNHNVDESQSMSDEMTWDDFYKKEENKLSGKYEVIYKYGSFPDERDSIQSKTRDLCRKMLHIPLKLVDSQSILYQDVIPHEQYNTRIIKDHRNIPRLDLESRIIDALNSKKKFIIVTGQSTSGKTYAICHAIKEKLNEDYKVCIMNANTSLTELSLLKYTIFNGEKNCILFLDDIQDIIWNENNVRDEEFLKREWPQLLENSGDNYHIIATSYMEYGELKQKMGVNCQGYLSEDNVEVINIEPLQKEEWEFYSRLLYSGGYVNKNQLKGIYTIGSLFIELDRLKNQYDAIVGGGYKNISGEIVYLLQICHSLKCIWIWKKVNRKDLSLLHSFLKSNFPLYWEGKQKRDLVELINKLHPLVNVNMQERLEVEDVIVEDIMGFLNKERPTLKIAINNKKYDFSKLNLVGYITGNIINTICKDEELKNSIHQNLTKLLTRLPKYFKQDAQIALDLIAELFINVNEPLKYEEIDNRGIDWTDCFLGQCIYSVRDKNKALKILTWAIKNNKITNSVSGLLRRYNSYFKRTDNDNDLISRDEVTQILSKEYKNGETIRQFCIRSHNINFIKELLLFEKTIGKELYKQLDITIPNIKSDNSKNDDNDLSNIFADVIIEDLKESPNDTEGIINFYHLQLCQAMFKQCTSWEEVLDLVEFLRENQKSPQLFPGELDKNIFFDFISVKTWRILTTQFEKDKKQEDLIKMAGYLIKIDVKVEERFLFLNKTETLNDILKAIDTYEDAKKIWLNMGINRDGFSLNFMLQKAKRLKSKAFKEALLVMGNFLGDQRIMKYNRISSQNINAMLNTASNLHEIEECESIFRQYGIIKKEESLKDFDDEYRMGIILKLMKMKEIHALLKKQLEERYKNNITQPRNAATLASYVIRAKYDPNSCKSAYEMAYDFVYGNADCITKEEQALLQDNAIVFAGMIDKVRGKHDAESVRNIFESESWGNMLANKDALILNRIIENNYIYPYYEDKIKAIKLKRNQGYLVFQNDYTANHLKYHKTYNQINCKKSNNLKVPSSEHLELLFLNASNENDVINIWKEYRLLKSRSNFVLNIKHLHAFALQLFRIYEIEDVDNKTKGYFIKYNIKNLNEWYKTINQYPFKKNFNVVISETNKEESKLWLKTYNYLSLIINKTNNQYVIREKNGSVIINDHFLLIWTLLCWMSDTIKLENLKSMLKNRLILQKIEINEYIRLVSERYPNQSDIITNLEQMI